MHPRLLGLGPHLSTGDVAAVLDWQPRTVRGHLMPLRQWRELVEESPEMYASAIPAMRLGAHWRVPRWWLEHVLEQLEPRSAASGATGRDGADQGERGSDRRTGRGSS